jgi:hypothetical protein
MAGTESLGQAVAWLSTEGIPAVGGLTTGRTAEATETCTNTVILYPSWQQLEQLQSQYGFQVISQSATYTGWPSATTTSEIDAESCNTLATFQQHGFNRAWGMFAPPDNTMTAQQLSIVQGCFGFNRKYLPALDSQSTITNAPYTAGTLSVTSGNCNDAAAACYNAIPGGKRYMLPSRIEHVLSPKPWQYNIVQFYRFVSGSGHVGTISWDCTSPNDNEHWVTSNELYCYNDFQTAVDAHGPNVTFTDPATVANAWMPGRASTLAPRS